MGRSGFLQLCAVKNRRVIASASHTSRTAKPQDASSASVSCGVWRAYIRSPAASASARSTAALRLDVLGGNVPAERLCAGQWFERRGTVRMFYADTGCTDYGLYEYLL